MASKSKTTTGQPVYINVYDMYTMNNYISPIGIGIYHCGVEVYGVEYGYGGHPFPFSGVFEMIPKDTEELGESFRFKETIEIGRTDFTKQEIEQIVVLMGRDFRGIDYHLMNKNCNNFSSKFCKTICGEDIPSWVNRLAYLTTYVPFIEKMVPKEWISPIAVQHAVESHMNETGETNQSSNNNNQTSYSLLTSTSSAQSQQQKQNSERPNGGNNIWSSIFGNLDQLEQNENIKNNNKAV